MKRKFNLIVKKTLFLFMAMIIVGGLQGLDIAYAKTGYTDHTHTFSDLEDCGGCKNKSGYADCVTCGKDGVVSCTNTSCSSGHVDCPKCEGGKVTCTTCNGKGYYGAVESSQAYKTYGCSACGGSGSQTDYFSNEYGWENNEFSAWTEGSYTKGVGYYTCLPTHYGGCGGASYINCATCGGDDSITCSVCNGNKYINKKCTRCNGTGQNQLCTNSQCTLVNKDYNSTYKWNNWASELSGNANGSNWLTSDAYTVCYRTANTYTITLNNQSATNAGTSNYYQKYDTGIYTTSACSTTISKITVPTKTGYTFNGYYTGTNGTGTQYINASGTIIAGKSTFSANTTLYAYWTENKYAIAFRGNGHTSGSTSNLTDCLYDNKYTLTANGYLKTGYTFKNWLCSNGGTYMEQESVSKLSSTNGATVTMTAQWTANTYTVTFEGNGGNVPSADVTKTVTYDSTYGALPTPSRTGYIFIGWYTTAEDTSTMKGTQITDSTKVSIISNTKLYARWEKNKYNIVYHVNGGTTVNGTSQTTYTAVIEYEDIIDLTIKATKPAYKFLGWSFTKDGFVIESMNKFEFGTEANYEQYLDDDMIHLYARYSIEVSDVYKCIFAIWNLSDREGTYAEYEMVLKENLSGGYTYALESIDVTGSLSNTNLLDISYCIYAIDNAKNVSEIYGNLPDKPEYFEQTVIHKVWDMEKQKYVEDRRTIEKILEGERYKPIYVDELLKWHDGVYIAPEYVVEGEKITEALYKPKPITVTMDGNGGTPSKDSITTYMNVPYGYFGPLPTATREGYSFAGWYTTADDTTEIGIRIYENSVYPYPSVYAEAGPVTLYARWGVNNYNVIYNYELNGGDSMESVALSDLSVGYGSYVNLNYKAYKNKWDFVGWSLDPDGEVKLTSVIMGISAEYEDGTIVDLEPGDITLYAIYNKAITYTFIDIDCERICPELPNPIWNRETQISITTPELHTNGEWKALGWAISKEAVSGITITENAPYQSAENVTFYGVYEKAITVTIDSGNPNNVIENITADITYNASGDITKIEIIMPDAGTQNNKSFDYWEVVGDDTRYKKGDKITTSDSISIIGHWDTYPTIFTNNKYYTLAQAKDGVTITYDQLLSYATATDKEDDAANIPVDVKIEGFYADEFANLTNSAEIQLTYVATDSFGNTTKRTAMIYIVNSQVQTDSKTTSTRFIGKEYFNTSNPTVFVDEADGGLRNSSLWKTNLEYSNLLTTTLSNTKLNVEYKEISFGLFTQTVEIPSSGNWEREYGRYMFTRDKIEEIKEYVKSNGFSRYQSADATTNFINQFMN